MLNDKYESRARQMQDEINRLTVERDEAKDAKIRAEPSLQEAKDGTRLLDRHKYLLWLGGDHAVYERIRPLRQEIRRCSRQIRRIEPQLVAAEPKILIVVDNGLEECDPAYRELGKNLDKLKKADKSCTQMLDLVSKAQNRIDEALDSPALRRRDEASRAEADQDASEVWDLVRRVRNHAKDVDKKVSHYGSLDPRYIKNLGTDFSGSHSNSTDRVRKFTDTRAQLDSIARDVESLLGAIVEKVRAVEVARLRRLQEERARFT